MSLSRILITFNEDFVDSDIFSFDVYNSVLDTTETITYTCKDTTNRQVNEFVEPKTTITVGSGTCINFSFAFYEDYGEDNWTFEIIGDNGIQITSKNEDIVFQNGSSLLDVGFSYSSIPVPENKDSYFYTFKDFEGNEHRVEIKYNPNHTNWVEIQGNYTISNPSNDDILSPLRPKKVTCNLEASTELNLQDLYNEEDKVYKVTAYRDSEIIFMGWLSPDGLYEDYVADKWILSLEAIDGLGFLKDISYTGEDGLLYSGKQTDINKLSNILLKTGLELGIRTSVNIYYEGLSTGDILSQTNFNTERYYTENNKEPFDCNKVLLSVLEKYNAVITQKNGYWYIYKPNEIYDNANVTFYNYDKDGVLVSGENTITEDLSFSLGSGINNFDTYFANGNQRKSLKRSLATYRVNLKYGEVFPYYTNTVLNWVDTSNINDWTIVNSSFVSPYQSLQGIRVTNAASPTIVMQSDNYTVDGTPRVDFKVKYSNLNDVPPTLGTGGATFNCKIVYVKGANTYYLTKNGDWVTSADLIQHAIGLGEKNFTLRVVAKTDLPEADGDIRIDLYDAGVGTSTFPIAIHNMSLQTYIGEGESQGQQHTIEKLTPTTPNTDSVKDLIHGDVPDNTYYSAIYESDGTTNTENWYRKNYIEEKPLLRIMVEDRLRMYYKPSLIFEGDVLGFVPFLSRINIDNVNDKMMLTEWSYDSYNNTTSIKAIELQNEKINQVNVAYSVTEDYGETIKPTIQG